MVNGGGIITLQFQRNPFYPIKKSVYVAWNDITVIQNPIVMYLGPSSSSSSQSSSSSSSTTMNNDHHGNEFHSFLLNSRIPFVFHNLFSHSGLFYFILPSSFTLMMIPTLIYFYRFW